MHVEITRLWTGWLSHADYGVNKLLATVKRNKLGTGTDAKPESVKIYNDVDFDIAGVAGVDPPSVPSLVVVSDLDLRGTDITDRKKSGYEFAATTGIGYYTDEVTRDKNVRDGNYVLRAVLKSVMAFNRDAELSKAYRELNDIRITVLNSITIQRVAGAVPESRLLGMVFVEQKILDKAP